MSTGLILIAYWREEIIEGFTAGTGFARVIHAYILGRKYSTFCEAFEDTLSTPRHRSSVVDVMAGRIDHTFILRQGTGGFCRTISPFGGLLAI